VVQSATTPGSAEEAALATVTGSIAEGDVPICLWEETDTMVTSTPVWPARTTDGVWSASAANATLKVNEAVAPGARVSGGCWGLLDPARR